MKIFGNHFASECLAVALLSFVLCFPPRCFALEGMDDELDVSLGELLNLELTIATKHPMSARKAPAISTVITEHEIRNMGARKLTDILRSVPGLSVSRRESNVGPSRVEVRGITTLYTEKVLLMIDGHKMNLAYEGTWTRICKDLAVDNIKRIEIIRGPGSALYGANAFVAVINVVTKSSEDIGGQTFSAGYGSFDTQHYNAQLSHSVSNLELSGHADYLKSDGPGYLIEEDSLTGSPASLAPGETDEFIEKLDAGLKMKYGDFSFLGRVIDRTEGVYIGPGFALNDESSFKFRHAFGDLGYTREITEKIGVSLRLYMDYFTADWDFELFPEGFTGGDDEGLLGNPKMKNRNLGGDLMADYVVGGHHLTAGFNYENAKQYDVWSSDNFLNPFVDSWPTPDERMYNIDVERDFWAVYIQDVWEITTNDSLTLGLRHDNYDDFGGTTNPRVGYVHEFGNKLTAKVLYGSAFRAPSFVELYEGNNPVIVGNTDLEPERIHTYEIGLEYPFLTYYTVRLSLFRNEIKDLIKYSQPDETGLAHQINVDGKTTVDGGEAEFALTFSKDSYGYLNCSYQNGEDEDGKELVDVSNWKANAGFNQKLHKYLNANFNFSWVGKRSRNEGDTRGDLDPQTLLDLCLIAKGFCNSLEILGSVHNVLDEDYRDPSVTDIPNDLPTNKRMFMVEVKYRF